MRTLIFILGLEFLGLLAKHWNVDYHADMDTVSAFLWLGLIIFIIRLDIKHSKK